MNLLAIFFTGLTTGGLSCLAVQGGLLAGLIANQKKQEKNNQTFDRLDWQPVTAFLIAKLISHTILGFFLGSLGSVITLSLQTKIIFQVLTALFMIATAMNLLDLHPIFRYLSFQPPGFLRRLIKNTSQSQALFAPIILGLLTVFIPCGVTQAMEVLAINSGQAATGALTMFSFVLGTMPLFGLIGITTARLSETWQKTFTRVAVTVLLIMAAYSFNASLTVLNSPFAIKFNRTSSNSFTPVNQQGIQPVTININNHGYAPNYIKVKLNVPVELTLISHDARSCAVAFVFNQFNIRTVLGANDRQTFNFTPTQPGRFTFSCSMGMYSGTMEVVQ